MPITSNQPDHTFALLTNEDPPAVTVQRLDGAGPGILLCDHASNAIPLALGQLGLADTELLGTHIAYDIGAREVTKVVSDCLDMTAVISGYSRLVIDLNRQTQDFTSIREIYDGSIIPGNRHLTAAQTAARIDEIYSPYHTVVEQILTSKSETLAYPAVISVHSCTNLYRGQVRPWHIGVLSNRDRRMADLVLAKLRDRRPDLNIGDNKPYSGLDPHGYTLETHAFPDGRPNVLFEVRQDLITTPDAQREYGTLLADVLGDVLQDNTLFSRFTG